LADETSGGEAQVGCNLTRAEGAELSAYAQAHELSRANLCALLVVRELHLRRIGELCRVHPGSGSRKGAARVTARVSERTKRAFAEHIVRERVGSDDAAAAIFRAELEEEWLSSILCQRGNRR
jgi:hypothetical protein